MKRGWITWDRTEIPPAAFEKRLDLVRAHLAARDLPALVVYTDVWRSNQGRYFSNFMPYWNRALIVIPKDGEPILLCALSPRVYPWIRSVTIFREILPSPNLAQQLTTVCGERGWTQIGVLDLPQLPQDLLVPNAVDVLWSAVHPTPDEAELLMYRHAAGMAREILEGRISGGAGLTDHEFTGRLERAFRRAGAEDLVILTTNGETPPLPPTGAALGDSFSAVAAMEYRGHWVKVGRCLAELPEKLSESKVELLSGAYPYEFRDRASIDDGSVFALHSEFRKHGRRFFHSDSYRQTPAGAELL